MALIHAHYALTDFARQEPDDELIIPDDLTGMADDDLTSLLDKANAAFEAIFGDGDDVSEEALEQLEQISGGITQLREELDRRATEKAERAEKAAEIAAKIKPAEDTTDTEDDGDTEADGSGDDGGTDEAPVAEDDDATPVAVTEAPAEPDDAPVDVPDDASSITESQPEPIAASANKPRRKNVRVNLSGLRQPPRPAGTPASSMRDIVTAAPDMPGYANGQGMDWTDIGKGINRRMQGFNLTTYERAQREGRHMRQQYSVAAYRKPIDPELTITSDDPAHIDAVMDRAVDEARLPGGSLVASGGWCAPSETVYDLCNLSSRDGMISVPEVGVSRGGIRYASSPSFADVYADTGFCYTEQEDIDGDYDGEGGGEKPCADVPCPTFEDYRLNLCGTCISSGLLQARGYPEALTDFTQKAMIAHDHRVNARVIQELIKPENSTAVTYPAPQAGATAPVLGAIEFQRELILQGERMSRTTSMEGIFPYWVRGVIRADLSRRLGVDLIDVSDQRINSWFTQRGINPQFVYDWQDLAQDAVEYPDTLDFLLYPAGSFVKGTEDVISLDTIYDSTQLGQNNFTALFFEEGWLVASRCGESRVVTVPICPSGSANSGELIGCDGTSSGSLS